MLWDGEATDKLKELWDQTPQLSASEIGAVFGCSRNAVLGRVHRLRLPTRISGSKPGVPRKEPQRKKHKPTPALWVRFQLRGPVLPVVPLKPIEFIGPGRPLLDLPNNACRFAINDEAPFLFCSAPQKDGSSYCAHHHAIAWVHVRKRKLTDEEIARRRQRVRAVRRQQGHAPAREFEPA